MLGGPFCCPHCHSLSIVLGCHHCGPIPSSSPVVVVLPWPSLSSLAPTFPLSSTCLQWQGWVLCAVAFVVLLSPWSLWCCVPCVFVLPLIVTLPGIHPGPHGSSCCHPCPAPSLIALVLSLSSCCPPVVVVLLLLSSCCLLSLSHHCPPVIVSSSFSSLLLLLGIVVVIPPTIHPTSSCSGGWRQVVCLVLLLGGHCGVLRLSVAPTIHPTSFCL